VALRKWRANVRGRHERPGGELVDGQVGLEVLLRPDEHLPQPDASSTAGTAVSTYCACPPSRWGGTTMRLATAFATAAPCSSRSRCRQVSMPAAVPALENTGSSSTYRTSGSTVTAG
jgi:hypothetical protein